jgi:pimeloyl-ACP methyl ester carboxylesterase
LECGEYPEYRMMADFRKSMVSANGVRFATIEAGTGPLVLCLHGFPDHAHSFRHQLPALAAAGFRAVAPFMRGYAPTEVPADGRYQSAVLARDIVELISALGYSSAHVFGHDWGAVAAYGAAILAPDKVTKLIAAAVPHGPTLISAFMSNYDQQRRSWYMFFFQHPLAEAAVAHDDFRFIERLWQDWSPGWQYPAEEMDGLKATFRAPGVLQAALGYYRSTLNPANQDPALGELQAQIGMSPVATPTLYFHGARDGCIGSDLAEGMEALFPNGLRKVVVPDAGHFVHQERPDQVNRSVLDFLLGP